MAMQKAYQRINWENLPSEKTPVDEINLNKMDKGIDDLDDRIVALDGQISSVGGETEAFKNVYIVANSISFGAGWLSETKEGTALSPKENVFYRIDTHGEYYGVTCYWSDKHEAYMLFGKTNVKDTAENSKRINFGEQKRYQLGYVDIAYSIRGNYLSIPVQYGDVLICNINLWSRNGYEVRIGFEGDSLTEQVYSGRNYTNSYYDYIKDIQIDERIARLNKPFRIYAYAPGYSGQGFGFGADSYITLTSGFGGYETNEYVGPTEFNEAQAGLVPSLPQNSALNMILMSDGKWHTIDELKTILGIG